MMEFYGVQSVLYREEERMAVEFESKDDIKKEFEEQDITLHCTRATCMNAFTLEKKEYLRILQEEGMIKCPVCNHRSL